MASKTLICNKALYKVGETRVSNVETDSSKKALILNDMYDSVRDSMLCAFPWNFAIARASIAVDGTAPTWGYTKRYLKPSNFLSLLEIDGKPDYKLEGEYIVTDHGSPLKIRYISKVTNTGDFDPLFVEALASKLALEACEPITQSNTKKGMLFDEYRMIIKEAYASDSIQDLPQDLEADIWLTAREDSYDDDIDYSL